MVLEAKNMKNSIELIIICECLVMAYDRRYISIAISIQTKIITIHQPDSEITNDELFKMPTVVMQTAVI